MQGERRGPGFTTWEPSKDGCISQRYHNDPDWVTTFARADELTTECVCRMLDKAYEMGLKDKAEQMRNILGAAEP